MAPCSETFDAIGVTNQVVVDSEDAIDRALEIARARSGARRRVQPLPRRLRARRGQPGRGHRRDGGPAPAGGGRGRPAHGGGNRRARRPDGRAGARRSRLRPRLPARPGRDPPDAAVDPGGRLATRPGRPAPGDDSHPEGCRARSRRDREGVLGRPDRRAHPRVDRRERARQPRGRHRGRRGAPGRLGGDGDRRPSPGRRARPGGRHRRRRPRHLEHVGAALERRRPRVHHIVDPASGLPAAERWRTVSVAAASCVDANGAATAAIVMGEAAAAWLDGMGLAARLVRPDGSVTSTSRWPAEAA